MILWEVEFMRVDHWEIAFVGVDPEEVDFVGVDLVGLTQYFTVLLSVHIREVSLHTNEVQTTSLPPSFPHIEIYSHALSY